MEHLVRSVTTWIGPGAWAGVTLTLARAVVLYAMDHVVRGHDLAMTRWRMAERLPASLVWSACVGLACAWILSRRVRSATLRNSAVCVCAALMLTALAGWPLDDAYHIPGPGTSRGLATLLGLALAACFGAALLRWLLTRTTWLTRRVDVVLALVMIAALPVIARVSEVRVGARMRVSTVVRDLVVDTSIWTVESCDPANLPRAGTITPDVDFRLDVGEMPALIMPPACRSSFVVPAGAGPLRLHGAAGCDLDVAQSSSTAELAPRIVFRVAIGDRTVFEHRRTPWHDEDPAAREWARLGNGDGIAVAPGDRVTVSVDVDRPSGASTSPISAGFGGLSLVRTRERERTRASASQPNVVLVVVDTLRADRASIHGYPRPTTPALQRLAARGVVYENACSAASWTWPSTASILTGLVPAEHGVESDTACYLSGELDTLAEVLQDAGWTTAAFSGNPLIAPDKNFGQGFETFDVAPGTFSTSDRIVPDALSWLDTHADVRFFLYLHLIDPHEIHRIPSAMLAQFAGDRPAGIDEHAMSQYADRLLANEARTPDGGWDPTLVVPPAHSAWLSAAYDAGVATSDAWLGRVLDRLDELGLSDRTLIAFTSDHGEEFLDHGHLKHGQSVYTELVHVPLVLAGPGLPHGRRSAALVSNIDLAGSLARAAGLRMTSASAVDLLHPDAISPGAVFTSTEYGWWSGAIDSSLRGMRSDGWSLHYCRDEHDLDPDHALAAGRARLYDLRRDPREMHDVAAGEPARARSMLAEIERREAAASARRPKAVRAGRGTLQLLQATGYAGQGR